MSERRRVRKLRHWKQRFNKNARFIWRRTTQWHGTAFRPGDEVPEGLIAPTKLRRFWEANRIELLEFEDPDVTTGRQSAAPAPTPDPVVDPLEARLVKNGRKWMIDGDPTRSFATKKAAMAVLVVEVANTLVGSSALESTYEIEGETVQLGEIVDLTFRHSGLTVRDWNAMDDADREARLTVSLEWMRDQGPAEDDWLG